MFQVPAGVGRYAWAITHEAGGHATGPHRRLRIKTGQWLVTSNGRES
jgi:hypothetical protein